MNSMDKATQLLFETITTLLDMKKQPLTLEQQEQLMQALENLEDIRALIYDIKNQIQTKVS